MEFGRTGASSNAFTDYCTTAYYVTGSGDFEKNLDLLVGFVSDPYFDDANVAKEKLIIEQELRMYEDSPDHRLYKNLMRILYTVHPVRLDIGGEVSDIQNIDRGLLESCYRMFYSPSNMDLIVAGDVDPAAVFERVERIVPAEKFPPLGEIGRHWDPEPAGVKERVAREAMDISRPRVLVGFKEIDAAAEDPLRRELELSVLLDLLFGRSSAFYTKAYEEGLIDDSFSFSYSGEDAFGFSLIGGETGEPERLAERVLEELHAARSRKPSSEDVERAKRKRIGKFIRSFDSPDGAAFLLLGCEPRGIDILEAPKVLTKISGAGLERRLRSHFDERNYAVSILTPKA